MYRIKNQKTFFSVAVMLLMLLLCNVQVQADETHSHVVNADNMVIMLDSVQANPDQEGSSVVYFSVLNQLSVGAIIRKVSSNFGKVEMQKKTSLFGFSMWNKKEFYTVKPGKITAFDGTKWRLVVSGTPEPDTNVVVTFDFGPKGHLDAQLSAP